MGSAGLGPRVACRAFVSDDGWWRHRRRASVLLQGPRPRCRRRREALDSALSNSDRTRFVVGGTDAAQLDPFGSPGENSWSSDQRNVVGFRVCKSADATNLHNAHRTLIMPGMILIRMLWTGASPVARTRGGRTERGIGP